MFKFIVAADSTSTKNRTIILIASRKIDTSSPRREGGLSSPASLQIITRGQCLVWKFADKVNIIKWRLYVNRGYLCPSMKGSCVRWCDRETLSSNGYNHYVSSGGGGGKPRTTIIKNTDHPQSHTSGDLEEEARTRAYSILASSRISFRLEGFVFLCL